MYTSEAEFHKPGIYGHEMVNIQYTLLHQKYETVLGITTDLSVPLTDRPYLIEAVRPNEFRNVSYEMQVWDLLGHLMLYML